MLLVRILILGTQFFVMHTSVAFIIAIRLLGFFNLLLTYDTQYRKVRVRVCVYKYKIVQVDERTQNEHPLNHHSNQVLDIFQHDG